jgi:hypothetical protein
MNNKVLSKSFITVGCCFSKIIIPLLRNLRMLSCCSNVDIAVNLERTASTNNCYVLHIGG